MLFSSALQSLLLCLSCGQLTISARYLMASKMYTDLIPTIVLASPVLLSHGVFCLLVTLLHFGIPS